MKRIKPMNQIKKKSYFNDGMQLYEAIFNLIEELERRAKKVTSVNYNEEKIYKNGYY